MLSSSSLINKKKQFMLRELMSCVFKGKALRRTKATCTTV